jgi:ribosomal-protein-alanine N-acetyltransferase
VPPPELLQARHVWLRRARLNDAADLFAAYASDPSATRYLSWPPRQTVGDVEEWLAPRVAGWEDGREYRWVASDEPDGEAFGTVSLRVTEPGFDLGYALATARSGEGIATAIVSRLLTWLDTSTSGATVTACTDPDNMASLKVLIKTGFREVRRDVASWRRPSPGEALRDSLIFERPGAG